MENEEKYYYDHFVFNYEEVRAIIGALCYDIRGDWSHDVDSRLDNIYILYSLIHEGEMISYIEEMKDDIMQDGRYLKNFDSYYGNDTYEKICKENPDSHLYYLRWFFNHGPHIQFRDYD